MLGSTFSVTLNQMIRQISWFECRNMILGIYEFDYTNEIATN